MTNNIKPKQVYMMIPTKWVCIYHKLLVYMSDFGLEMLQDCQAGCKSRNRTITDCWNTFQAALAAENLGKTKEAEVLITYIKAQLKAIYKSTDKEDFNGGYVYPINEDGTVEALISCTGYDADFEIDPETGELMVTSDNEDTIDDFSITENDLTHESN